MNKKKYQRKPMIFGDFTHRDWRAAIAAPRGDVI